MNFGKSFTYIFEDPQWFDKLWKPVLCMLIPVIGPPLVFQGYIMDVIKKMWQMVTHAPPCTKWILAKT